MRVHPPLQEAKFNLDVSGIAGFFGGEESFAAMATVHFMRGRRWMGWYNSPGSYYVAKKYGTLAKSRLWNGLFPGPTIEPAAMLELDSKHGPRYMGVYSGTRIASTGHLSYLLTRHCEHIHASSPPTALEALVSDDDNEKTEQDTRIGPEEKSSRTQISITLVKLKDFKTWKGYPTISEKHFLPFEPLSGVVTLCTIAGGILSAIWGDWFSFSMIFLGGISNGVSYFVLGSGRLDLDSPEPSINSPPGDGILISPRHIIVLQGDERSVSVITRGRYSLHYDSAPKYRDIGTSSVILTAQFLLQLFLVSQGELIGQVMFLATFVVSWIFNAYLASVDREKPQTDVLMSILNDPDIEKFHVNKYVTAAAFVTFYLEPKDPENTLNEFIPNSTPAWNLWKKLVLDAIAETRPPGIKGPEDTEAYDALTDANEQKFVKEFLALARQAYRAAEEKKSVSRLCTPNDSRRNSHGSSA